MKLERNLMARIGGTLLLACALVTVSATRADATFLVALDVNGSQYCVSDNNSGCTFGTAIPDTDPAVGSIEINNTNLQGLQVNGSAQIATYGPPTNVLNTSSLQLINQSSVDITATLAVSATDFTPPAFTAFASGSGTWQQAVESSIEMGFYNDPDNGQGAETATDTPGDLIASFSEDIDSPADATAFAAGPLAVNDPNPFSMTLFTKVVLVSGGTLVGNSQTEFKPVEAPEPATLTLFGLGLMGAGAVARRRRQANR